MLLCQMGVPERKTRKRKDIIQIANGRNNLEFMEVTHL